MQLFTKCLSHLNRDVVFQWRKNHPYLPFVSHNSSYSFLSYVQRTHRQLRPIVAVRRSLARNEFLSNINGLASQWVVWQKFHYDFSFFASDFSFSDLNAFKKKGNEKANISTPRYAANPSG